MWILILKYKSVFCYFTHKAVTVDAGQSTTGIFQILIKDLK